MTVSDAVTGRGAWSKSGKYNDSARYCYVQGKEADGSRPNQDINTQAVYYAVLEIQKRCNELLTNKLTVDGKYGANTAIAVSMVQKMYGLFMDGQTGSITSQYLWKPVIELNGRKYVFPAKYLYGQVMNESSLDIGAVGSVTNGDRGLVQINLPSHPDISVGDAFSSHYALDYSAHRFADAMKKYESKPERQLNAAILQHNSPYAASVYWNTGIYLSQKSKDYIAAVLKYAAQY